MNCVFKGYFEQASEAEAAYYALRDKHLVYDLETSDLVQSDLADPAPRIAYASETTSMGIHPGISGTGAMTAGSLSNNDPRVAITPFLVRDSRPKNADSFYLYGHCRKKDLDTVTACLKQSGAFSVLSSATEKAPQIHSQNLRR